jgi:hypothetical protein
VSVRLEVATQVRAPVTRVGMSWSTGPASPRWIPFTTLRITTPHDAG